MGSAISVVGSGMCYGKSFPRFFEDEQKTGHGKKGFLKPTKSFLKVGITKIFYHNNKIFGSINKTFGCCGKIFGCSNKNSIVVPNFVAVTKPFFSLVYACCVVQLFFRRDLLNS